MFTLTEDARVVGARTTVTLSLVLVASCASMGPKTIPTDQFNYNSAIASSGSEQLLLNIVRLRYSEAPVFLRVSSVINQYSRGAGVAATVGANTSVTGEDTAGVSGQAAWADRPTITYTPVTGREFATNLLTPLPPGALFQLVQAGWPPELVLRVAVISINGLENEMARPSLWREADPRFLELLELIGRMRTERALGMRVEKGVSDVSLFFPKGALGEQARTDRARFRELLGLAPDVEELHVTNGFIAEKPDELAVLTGSIWDVMVGFAWRFDVPPEHVEQGRTDVGFGTAEPGLPLIHVRYGRGERPADAHVAVFSRGYWFYVDDRDRDAKRAFSFLQLLLSLAEEGGTAAAGPVVTIAN